jgi:esterase/lipase superfamily enzyme
MISNRKKDGDKLGREEGALTFWTAGDEADPKQLAKSLKAWKPAEAAEFKSRLIAEADRFPAVRDLAANEDQRHVCLFVHGYNNSWDDAVRRYCQISSAIFGDGNLGFCVLFSWPSDGLKLGYYPDRLDARRSGDDLAEVLSTLYDEVAKRQQLSMLKGKDVCKAKVSMIAHSMGNFVMQKAMQHVWTRKNKPLLMSLVNQLLMVAADVDNDLFRSGENLDQEDGDAIANLCYRVTVLYTGLDATLGLSAGFKHFGKRRLGRTGLDLNQVVPDNVWSIDCSQFLEGKPNTHSAYFDVPDTQAIMQDILRGVDRSVLTARRQMRSVRLA